MQNLWQRLKPAYKKKILSNKEFYPHSIRIIRANFISKTFWSDLTVDTVRQTFSFTHNNLTDVSINDLMYGSSIY